MCVVSFVTAPTATNTPFWDKVVKPRQVEYDWTPNTWAQFKEILDKLKDLDAKLGLKDCEDESKGAWMKEVEKRLTELEQK